MNLKKFLLHSLILIVLTVLFIELLVNTPGIVATTQLNYLYSGSYEPISWPIINVTLTTNESLINGIVIVVSPSTESINEAFTGLLVLPNNTSYVITGFLGSSSIYVISIERMPNQSLINTQYGYSQYYTASKESTIKRILGGLGSSTNGSSAGNLSREEGTRTISKHGVTQSINYPLIIITTMIITMSISFMAMYMRSSMKYPECLEYGITKIVRRMRISDPGLTPRELGNYIIDRTHDKQTVEEMIRLFEEGMYGRREIDCRKFMTLIKKVLKRI